MKKKDRKFELTYQERDFWDKVFLTSFSRNVSTADATAAANQAIEARRKAVGSK